MQLGTPQLGGGSPALRGEALSKHPETSWNYDFLQYSAAMIRSGSGIPSGSLHSPQAADIGSVATKPQWSATLGEAVSDFWGALWGSIGGTPNCTSDRHRQKGCGGRLLGAKLAEQTAMSARWHYDVLWLDAMMLTESKLVISMHSLPVLG